MKALTRFLCGSVLGIACTGPAQAQAAYPDKPIQIVLSFPAGGGTDVLTRAVGARLSQSLGQAIVVDNRPGAGGAIGLHTAARSTPDGYTLYMASVTSQAIAASVYGNQKASLVDDFTPIAGVGKLTHALIVPASLPVSTVKELIEYVKANPGKHNYASQGAGTLSHLESEIFIEKVGLDMVHVPYKGSTQALPDVVNGSSIMMFDSITTAQPLVQAGKLKMLAVASAQRVPFLPDVPTLAESGVEGFDATVLFGLAGPKGIPQEVVDRVAAALKETVEQPELQKALQVQGFELAFMPPAEFGQAIVGEHKFWGDVVKSVGVSLNP